MGLRYWARIAAVAVATVILCAGLTVGTAAGTTAAHADVNDFTIQSFDAEYVLGRDDEGRSSLTTTEHIVARFPDFDQNRGLIRDLTNVYDGHSTGVEVLSVTDETGAPRDYTTTPSGDFLSVTIAVPEGSYVQGEQHYVIQYIQRDVTRTFDDTGADEFYWDINGTDWAQPFDRVSARVVLDPALAESLNGNTACYRGAFGANLPCDASGFGEDPTVFTAEATRLDPGENVTIAIGFDQGIFAAAPAPAAHFLQRFPILIWGGLASLAAALVTFVSALITGRSARTGRAIIAQYEPPAGISVALSAVLLRANNKAMTASLLDFAVRRKLRLLHHQETDQYGVQSLSSSGLLPIDDLTFTRIFNGSTNAASVAPGTTYWFSPESTRLGDAAVALKKRAQDAAKAQGLVKPANKKIIGWVVALMIIALTLPIFHSVIFGDFALMTVLLAVGINVLIWGLFGMIALLARRRRPTYEGALLLDHLKGLREYIRLAEADRIRMLQSASGVEVNDQYVVHVYELLLPYAVLFGLEKEWQGELAKYYRESTPDWVAGSGTDSSSFIHALPIAAFTHAVSSSATTRATSGFGSGASFSSSSGGSSGGGFSGGGGGGGGGGGI